jgi:hypothetical protein
VSLLNRRRWLWFFVGAIVAMASIAWLLERRWNQWFSVIENKKAGILDRQGRIYPGRRIRVQSILECSFESAWEYALTSGLMHQVSWPLLQMNRHDGEMPKEWFEGDRIRVNLTTLGFIPLGEHEIFIETVDMDTGVIHSMEHGHLIPSLDHRISLQPYGKHLTLYTDEVSVYAGIFTAILAWGVRFFYRYRQTRWQWLARECR